MSLVITQALGLVTVQDFGRLGRMHEGLAHGGALVRSLLVRANRHAQNRDDAAAIEVLGKLVIRATARIEVALDDGSYFLDGGDELVVTSEPRRVAYLAIRGGVDAPLVLGSRSTHLSAGLGAPLRAGMQLEAGNGPAVDAPVDDFVDADTIRVIPGPDTFDETITSSAYRVSPTSDRVGTRLDGPMLAQRSSEASRPMVLGAIEVPNDGRPIVLGPEHPTTGGYPVIAVIASCDIDRFFAIRLGGTVRFVL